MTQSLDYISANLPAINLDQTRTFYELLGFKCNYQSESWMIMQRGSLHLEFFLHAQLDPKTSWHSACVRVQALEKLYETWKPMDWSQHPQASMTEIEYGSEIDLFNLIDVNGSLLRCIRLDPPNHTK